MTSSKSKFKILISILLCLSLLCGCAITNNRVASSSLKQTTSNISSNLVTDSMDSSDINSSETSASEPSSSSLNVISQSKLLSDIDMVTINSGYAITQDFHIVKTLDNGSNWTNILTINSVSVDSENPALFVLDDKTVYVASFTTTGIDVYKSVDAGANWNKSTIKMQVDDVNSGYGGSLFLSFINDDDGFLIANASPAAGLMSKALYKTTDGGINWSLVNNWNVGGDSLISSQADDHATKINGYTTGMSFSNAHTGFITCKYHGQTEISVYKTSDGGKNWSVDSFPLPEKYTANKGYYVDAYPPTFFGEGNKNAKMELYFCSNNTNESNYYFYSSDNGGETFHIDGIINMGLTDYCFVDDKNGFGLDGSGNIYSTSNGGITWSMSSSSLISSIASSSDPNAIQIINNVSEALKSKYSDINITNEWLGAKCLEYRYVVLFGSLKSDPRQGIGTGDTI